MVAPAGDELIGHQCLASAVAVPETAGRYLTFLIGKITRAPMTAAPAKTMNHSK